MNKSDDDVFEIIRFLKETNSLLIDIVEKSEIYFLKDFALDKKLKTMLKEPLSDVGLIINNVIKDIKYKKDDILSKLHKNGLTGFHLQLKMKVFDSCKELLASKPHGWNLTRVLKVVNSLLGSLAKVFSSLEIVKEFKETLEQLIAKKRWKSNSWV